MLPTSSEREDAAVKNAATPFVNHAAYAQDTCAAFACSVLSFILVILLDASLLPGSIVALLITQNTANNRMTARPAPACGLAHAA